MNDLISALLVLQERDLRVLALSSDLEDLPEQIGAIEAELATRTAAFEAIKSATRAIEVERKKLDLEVQARQAAIARYRSQQQQTRKNEEFAALNHEIAHAEKEIVALEDRELELMERFEAGQQKVAQGQKDLATSQERAQQRRGDLEKRIAAVRTHLVEAQAKQAEAVAAVDPDVVTRYRRILKSKGTAVVPVQGGNCSGCHMKLTHQTVISAQKAQGLVACENCGRLVY